MSDSSDQGASQVLEMLATLDIAHQVMDCDPELADTAVFCAHYNIPPENSANVIIAVGKSEPRQYAACVVLATTKLDVNKCVRKKMGVKKSSFASPEETKELTGMQIGGVTALGLPESLPLWVDSRVMDCEYIILGGGSRSIKIRISPRVFDLTPNTEVVEGLAVEIAPAGA